MKRLIKQVKSLYSSENGQSDDVCTPMNAVVVTGDNADTLLFDDDHNKNAKTSESSDEDHTGAEYVSDNDYTEVQDENSQQQTKHMIKENRKIRCLNTRVLNAIEDNNTEELLKCLKSGASPNATCFLMELSACHAAAYSNADALEILLRYGADVNREDAIGRTPLKMAAWAGNDRAVRLILDRIKDETDEPGTHENQESETCLKDGIYDGRFAIPCRYNIDSLIIPNHNFFPQSWGDSIEHKCETFMTHVPKLIPHWTPLHISSYAANVSTTELLLSRGSDPTVYDVHTPNPLDITGAACFLEEHNVNVDNYIKTIKVLFKSGAKFKDQKHILHDMVLCKCHSAIHTAVELCSVEAITMFLDAGALLSHYNERGNTPLHECVLKGYEELLELIISHRRSTQIKSAIDLTNVSGETVLHMAIIQAWIPGVRLALDAGADVTKVHGNGMTAIHMAASLGNVVILREVLENVHDRSFISYESDTVDAPIILAMKSGNLDCVRMIVQEGAPLDIKKYFNARHFACRVLYNLLSGFTPKYLRVNPANEKGNLFLHAAIDIGDLNMLKQLLEQDKNLYQLLDYKSVAFMNKTPIEFTIWCIKNRNKVEEDIDMLIFLLDVTSEINVNDVCSILETPVTCHDKDLFEMLSIKVPEVKSHYSELLHCAIINLNEMMILELIECGADLSATYNGETAVSSLMRVHPNAAAYMATIFDSYIKTNKLPVNHKNNQISIKYKVLVPSQEEPIERMQVLTAILNTGNEKDQRKLLKHLLVESFIHWNWKAFSWFFYMLIVVYSLFVSTMTLYIVSDFYNNDVKNLPNYLNPCTWQYPVYVLLVVVVILELSYTNIADTSWKSHIKSKESWMKFATYSLSMSTLFAIIIQTSDMEWLKYLLLSILGLYFTFFAVLMLELAYKYIVTANWRAHIKSIESWITFGSYVLAIATLIIISIVVLSDTEWLRHLASLTLVLVWVNLMVFFSSTPMFGYYMQIFWKVTKEVRKILLTFLLVIIMFTAIFMIQFRFAKPFDGPITALVKTLVMMTSEFDYENNFGSSIFILRFIFVMFLIVISITLMNIITGMAVNDVQNLVENGTLRRLEMQVYLMNRLEVSMKNKCLIFNNRRIRSWFQGDKVPVEIYINPFLDIVQTRPLGNPESSAKITPLKGHEVNIFMESILDKVRCQFDKVDENSSNTK